MPIIDPFSGACGFPHLNSLCEPIRVKYGYPADVPGWDSLVVPEEVYAEFSCVAGRAEQWLTDNYGKELCDLTRNPHSGYSGGIHDARFVHPSHKSAMDHGGWPGQDFRYWTSKAGQMQNTIHKLSSAYSAVTAKRAADEAAAEKKREEEAAAAARRKEEAVAARKRAEAVAAIRRQAEIDRREREIEAEVQRRLDKMAFDAEVERRLLARLASAPKASAPKTAVPAGGAGFAPAFPNVVEVAEE
jgi:hypothetical protein